MYSEYIQHIQRNATLLMSDEGDVYAARRDARFAICIYVDDDQPSETLPHLFE